MGNPHAGFDEAGAGNGLLGTAPALDPTCERLKGKFLWSTRLNPRPSQQIFNKEYHL